MEHYIRYIKQTSSQRSLNAVRALFWASSGKMRKRNQNFLLFSRGMTDRLIHAEDAGSIAYG